MHSPARCSALVDEEAVLEVLAKCATGADAVRQLHPASINAPNAIPLTASRYDVRRVMTR
ncbi:MAG TPA: hypothetical protein VGL75_07535 [Acidothermaceae bacterium]|jgi:hypothetical protein